MEGIRSFLAQIDGRIFEFNFANFGNKAYLFEPKPQEFYMQSWAFVLGLLAIGISVLILLFLKKRRTILFIEKGRRHILGFHTKINIVFFALFLVLIFFRSQGMMYVSMRFLAWMCLGMTLVSSLSAIIRLILYKSEHELETEIKTDDTYQKYLPKKKKK